MQPMQPYPTHAAQQALQAINAKVGRDALENMIDMGRAMHVVPIVSTPVSANMPPANAAAGALPLPTQQGREVALDNRADSGHMYLQSIKKVKLDSNGLIAVDRSTTVTTKQPLLPPQPTLNTMRLGSAQQGSYTQQSPGLTPSTGVALSGLTLHVHEDKTPISPSQLFKSAAQGVPPSPHYQPCVDRAPLRVPCLSSAPDCGNSDWAPYKEAPSIQHSGSGSRQRVGQCLSLATSFACLMLACKLAASIEHLALTF